MLKNKSFWFTLAFLFAVGIFVYKYNQQKKFKTNNVESDLFSTIEYETGKHLISPKYIHIKNVDRSVRILPVSIDFKSVNGSIVKVIEFKASCSCVKAVDIIGANKEGVSSVAKIDLERFSSNTFDTSIAYFIQVDDGTITPHIVKIDGEFAKSTDVRLLPSQANFGTLDRKLIRPAEKKIVLALGEALIKEGYKVHVKTSSKNVIASFLPSNEIAFFSDYGKTGEILIQIVPGYDGVYFEEQVIVDIIKPNPISIEIPVRAIFYDAK